MLHFADCGPFERNAQDPLGLFEMLRVLCADEAKEAMDRRQPNIACARFVLAHSFQVLEECDDPVHGEVLNREEGGILVFACGMSQEQL